MDYEKEAKEVVRRCFEGQHYLIVADLLRNAYPQSQRVMAMGAIVSGALLSIETGQTSKALYMAMCSEAWDLMSSG